MERLLLAAMVTISIANTASQPALANKTAVNSRLTQNQVVRNITPFDLVSFAYRGQLKGVPGYISLLNAVKFNQISGKDLVKHGIDNGRLSPDTINNSAYIRTVEYKLQDLLKS